MSLETGWSYIGLEAGTVDSVCAATVDFSLSLEIGLLSILEEGTGELDDYC